MGVNMTQANLDELVIWSLAPEYAIIGWTDVGTPIYAPVSVDASTIVECSPVNGDQ